MRNLVQKLLIFDILTPRAYHISLKRIFYVHLNGTHKITSHLFLHVYISIIMHNLGQKWLNFDISDHRDMIFC